ncbi:MAG: ABC transporter ATP-binding protein [Verrucomicrobiales bacterium]
MREQEFWALKDVSFQVKRGESIGIIGSNGAGKSTILKLLSGILRPNKGNSRVHGRLSALIEVGAGFHNDLTGRENIYLNASIMGMQKKETDSKFDRIVAFSELSEFIDTPVKRYSSGMYARLGFAVAAHMDPDILLVDEVLSVGDISFQAKCIQKIKDLKKNNTTIIFISHNMEAMLELCPRIILLDKGMLRDDGDARKIVKQYKDSSLRKYLPDATEHLVQSDLPIFIREVSFLNQEGEETIAFPSGSSIAIKIVLEAKDLVWRPVLGIAFYSENGTCIYGHNSKVDNWNIGDVQGQRQVTIAYRDVNLVPGHYLVTVGIFDSLGINAYEYKDRAYGFSISGNEAGQLGIIYFQHDWKNCP